jgi:D-threo-aldose 1-dehydrogenase
MPVTLPGIGRETSRLAFGTSGLYGGWSYRSSMRLLDICYEAGVRHIDTAPLYGLGSSESVVGEFLARHNGQVTVTTKFGLSPPKARAAWQTARVLVKPIVSRIPGAKRRALNTMSALGAAQVTNVRSPYTAAALRSSLENSLRNLRCARIDIFLLHEAQAEDLNDELRHVLDTLVAEGSIGCWGFGSARSKIDRIVNAGEMAIPVLQFEWSVLSNRLPHYPGSFTITHGALKDTLTRLQSATSHFRREFLQAIDRDPDEPGILARLLVSAALAANKEGIVLFTSKLPEHIRGIANLAQETRESEGKRVLEFFSGIEDDRSSIEFPRELRR